MENKNNKNSLHTQTDTQQFKIPHIFDNSSQLVHQQLQQQTQAIGPWHISNHYLNSRDNDQIYDANQHFPQTEVNLQSQINNNQTQSSIQFFPPQRTQSQCAFRQSKSIILSPIKYQKQQNITANNTPKNIYVPKNDFGQNKNKNTIIKSPFEINAGRESRFSSNGIKQKLQTTNEIQNNQQKTHQFMVRQNNYACFAFDFKQIKQKINTENNNQLKLTLSKRKCEILKNKKEKWSGLTVSNITSNHQRNIEEYLRKFIKQESTINQSQKYVKVLLG